MKEIKFRAWDKTLNKWVDPSMVYLAGDGTLRSWGDRPVDTERYVLYFYTGLKDKNGVEIYEGDVITIVDKASDWTEKISREKFSRFIVEWSETLAGWYPKSLNGYEPDETWWQTWEVEVIGNIYENPQLLTGGDRG